jgi:hypothetical protein
VDDREDAAVGGVDDGAAVVEAGPALEGEDGDAAARQPDQVVLLSMMFMDRFIGTPAVLIKIGQVECPCHGAWRSTTRSAVLPPHRSRAARFASGWSP